MKKRLFSLLPALLFTLPFGATLSADTGVWTGKGTAGWNSAANWQGGSAPLFNNETDLIWHAAGAARLAANENAIAGNRTIRSLTFDGNVTGNVALRLTVGSGSTIGHTLTFEAATGNAAIIVDAGASGNITLGAAGPGSGETVQIHLESNLDIRHEGRGLLHLDRIVGGTGALHKEGSGTLRLSAANVYTGGTTITAGHLEANHASALGSGAATISGQGRLAIAGNVTLNQTSIILEEGGTLSRAVGAGSAYSLGTTGSVSSRIAPGRETTLSILEAQAASKQTEIVLSMSGTSNATNDAARLSDVADLSGIAGNDVYVIQLTLAVEGEARLVWLDPTQQRWVDAIEGNVGGTPLFAGDVAYDPSHFQLGTYGFDSASGTYWAVVNHGGAFAVASIPEPSAKALAALVLVAGLGLCSRRIAPAIARRKLV